MTQLDLHVLPCFQVLVNHSLQTKACFAPSSKPLWMPMALENFEISRRHLVVLIQPSTVLIVVTMAFGDTATAMKSVKELVIVV